MAIRDLASLSKGWLPICRPPKGVPARRASAGVFVFRVNGAHTVGTAARTARKARGGW